MHGFCLHVLSDPPLSKYELQPIVLQVRCQDYKDCHAPKVDSIVKQAKQSSFQTLPVLLSFLHFVFAELVSSGRQLLQSYCNWIRDEVGRTSRRKDTEHGWNPQIQVNSRDELSRLKNCASLSMSAEHRSLECIMTVGGTEATSQRHAERLQCYRMP